MNVIGLTPSVEHDASPVTHVCACRRGNETNTLSHTSLDLLN